MKRFRFFLTVICIGIFTPLFVSAEIAEPDSVAGSDVRENIVARLSRAGSSVCVEAPGQLLLRAVPQTEDASADSSETAQDDASEEKTYRTKGGKTVGYRVQVYADNNIRTAKTEARQRERIVSGAFPQWAPYVAYAAPYWRLRVGDFRSQYDAEKAAAELRKQFPRYAKEIRVVRDRINDR